MKKSYLSIYCLILLGLISLGLISLADRSFFELFRDFTPSLAIVADLRLTSFCIVVIIWITIKFYFPQKTAGRVFSLRQMALPILWLAGTAYFVLIKKVWVPELNTWIDYFAFMVTGLLAEELLFRGALFDLSLASFGEKKIASLSLPVLITSALFSLQHLGYHNFMINSHSLSQISYTFGMGVVLGSLRQSTGILWPVILLHFLTNIFTVIRNLV